MEFLYGVAIIGGIALYLYLKQPIIFWGLLISLFIFLIYIFMPGSKNKALIKNDRRNNKTDFFHENEMEENQNMGHHIKGKCNGDCANCPPHYGYRYGKWYYGHDHIEGCEFGGNKGGGGM